MEIALIFIFGAIVFAIIVNLATARKNSEVSIEKKIYSYTAKPYAMTTSEADFFKRLVSISQEKYLVFPQMHLSSFIDFKVKGQNWKAAFRHINGKSVDYLLCDIETLQPCYAVELDDWTHSRDDRKERDVEVERIMAQAGVPLVRFENYKALSDDGIIAKFADTQNKL